MPIHIFNKLKKFINKHKFTPNILIWELVIEYEEDVEQRFYFLSIKKANKFIEKNMKELKDCYHWYLGGVQLWI